MRRPLPLVFGVFLCAVLVLAPLAAASGSPSTAPNPTVETTASGPVTGTSFSTAGAPSSSPVVADSPIVAANSTPGAEDSTAGATAEPSAIEPPAEPIDVTYRFHLDDDGPLVVEIAADVPAAYRERGGTLALDLHLNEDAVKGAETEGFEGDVRSGYVWDGSTGEPTVTIEFYATDRNGRFGGYDFYADGEWAVADLGTEVRYEEDGREFPDAIVESSTPEAAVGTHMTYVGPHEERAIDGGGQEIRLVVPEETAVDEDEVAAALEAAGTDLRVGARAEAVLAIVVRDPIRVGGLAYLYPHADFWVHEDVGTYTWVHEYVHTRQGYRTTASTKWLVEAEADYLPAVQRYERGEIAFSTFEDRLEPGGGICDYSRDYEGVVLAEPDTWSGTNADYCKGRLVLGALDAEIRAATDGERTYADVMREVNGDGDLTEAEFTAAVETVAGEPMDGFLEAYVRDGGIPETPDDPDRYGAWAAFDVSLAASLPDGPIATGEETTVPVAVDNEGDDPAIGVEATLAVPEGWTVVDAGEGLPAAEGVSWSAAELAPGEGIGDEVTLYAPDGADGDELLLTATDADGNRVVDGSDANAAPTASLAIDDAEGETAVFADEPVVLDAGDSEADAAIDRYEWDLTGDGETDETTAEPAIERAFAEPGERTVTVAVVDEHGLTDEADATVTVVDVPSIDVDAPDAAVEGEPIALEATVENEVGAYDVTWTFPGGETATGEEIEREFIPGEREITVAVEDEYGAASTAVVTITVTDRPTVAVEAPAEAVEGEEITLEAIVENEIGAHDVTWALPDGETATGETITHAFGPGEYDVEAIVEDEYGAATEVTYALTVTADGSDGFTADGDDGSAGGGADDESADGETGDGANGDGTDDGGENGAAGPAADGADDAVLGFGPLVAIPALLIATLAIRCRSVK